MKNTWKKLLAMTLVASMLTGMMGVGAWAEGDGTGEKDISEITAGDAYSNREDTQITSISKEEEKIEKKDEQVTLFGMSRSANEDYSDYPPIIAEYLTLVDQLPEANELTQENYGDYKDLLKNCREVEDQILYEAEEAVQDVYYDDTICWNAADKLYETEQKYTDLVREFGEPGNPTPSTPVIAAVDEDITVTLDENGVFTIEGEGTFHGMITVNGIETHARDYEAITAVVINGAGISGSYADTFAGIGRLTSLTATNARIDANEFKGAFAENADVKLINCSGFSSYNSGVFADNVAINVDMENCTFDGYIFDGSTLTSLEVSDMELTPGLFANCTINGEVDLSTVTAVRKAAFDNTEGSYTLTNIPQDIILENSHGFNSDKIIGLNDRIVEILSNSFTMVESQDAVQLNPENWTSSKVGTDNEVGVPATQVTEEARWSVDNDTVADVLAKAYYTETHQMDFVFVMDSSNSMGNRGTEDALNARYYEMQSKLVDVASKLLDPSDDYDCRMALVGFGGDDYSYHYPFTQEEGLELIPGTSFKVGFMDNSEMAKTEILRKPVYNEWTNYDIGLKLALDLVQENKEAGRATTVVLISDGMPQGFEKETFSNDVVTATIPDAWVKTLDQLSGISEANQIKALGAQIFGVLQSVPVEQLDDAETVMEKICTGGKYFTGNDTQGFSNAINDAIYQGMQNYTMTWKVNPDFTLNEETLNPSKDSVVQIFADNEGNTVIAWTLSGQTYQVETLSYQLKLKDELANRYGTYSYDINLGNADLAAAGALVNTVETPVLTRNVERPSEGGGTTYYILTINYVDEDGNVVADQHRERLESGSRYSVTSPTVENMTPDQTVVEGRLTSSTTIDVVYTADEPVVSPKPTGTPEPTPTETPVIEDLGENDTPLAELPAETQQPATEPSKEEIEELEDGDVPMAEAPETGDDLGIWLMMSAGALFGLAWLGKKKEEA